MTKREKATAISLHSTMVAEEISANMILTFATTAEIHGYHKGLFRTDGYQANLYTLIGNIRKRKEKRDLVIVKCNTSTPPIVKHTHPVVEPNHVSRPQNGDPQLVLF
ncbi:MAG: hypothetical protein HON76_13105 [Candidatus Scalindua sp.]|jgi:hypothetical protein|nr:hypothetical protein [Candidatus Scalindua sp.]